MNSITIEIAGHEIGIAVYANEKSFLKAAKRMFGKSINSTTQGLTYYDPSEKSSMVLLYKGKKLMEYALHEMSHVADFMWKEWRRRPEFKGASPTEFRAYMLCDLYKMFTRWAECGFRGDESILEDVFFDDDGAWGKILKETSCK